MNINELLGNLSDKEIHENFDGMSEDEILDQLNEMYDDPREQPNNEEMAEAIYEFCNK